MDRSIRQQQSQQSQQPLNIITNTINSRPSLLRKPTQQPNDHRISYPPPSDSKFIEQQPLLTNADIKLEGDENSSNNNNNGTKNVISNVSMQISQLNSSHSSRAFLMQKRNNPTTNIRPTVKKKIDDSIINKSINNSNSNSNFKKIVSIPNPIISNTSNNNNNKNNIKNNNNNNNNSNGGFKIPSPKSTNNTTTTTTSSSPLNTSPLNTSSTSITSPLSTSTSTSTLLNNTTTTTLNYSPTMNFEKSNLFSSMYISNTINQNNNQLNESYQLHQQKREKEHNALQERIGKIDQFTQSVRGELLTTFDKLQESYKPPRISLSINDIKERLDYEEKNKENEKLKNELKILKQSFKDKEKELINSQYQIGQLMVSNESLKRELQQSNEKVDELNHEIRSTSLKSIEIDDKFNNMQSLTKDRDDQINRLNQLLIEKDKQITQLIEKSRLDEKLRKQLHNQIQELKGNIRVFCRIRPDFSNGTQQPIFQIPIGTDNSLDVYSPTINTFGTGSSSQIGGDSMMTTKKTNYTFDRVFGPNSTQEMVFEDISQLVQSSLDGYNTCIFTYGQTGSGKTHSILGDLKVPSQRGMIPRTVEKIFGSIQELKEKGWKYQIECFFLEIYNETINDLLNTRGSGSGDIKYEIKHLENNNTIVTNITTVNVTAPSQVYELLALANKTRSVAKTLCNERSSRSHTVFQLKLIGENQNTNERVQGLLNLIDLAGSERVSRSGVEGKQLKETQAINKSLSSLGDVISALANKEQHIPYRNSKLTYLLQNSIGGNSKTLMFVNISPEFKDLQESTSSLRFASKVNSCELGMAKKNKN